jgi:hypothetical protein
VEYKIKDSGKREEFITGSRRDTRENKGRFDQVPTLPLRRLAQHYERGNAKYGERNWQKGQFLMRYIDSALRHINALIAGEPEEDHATAAIWNLFSYIWTLDAVQHGRLPDELDDRPEPESQYMPEPKIAEEFLAPLDVCTCFDCMQHGATAEPPSEAYPRDDEGDMC